MVSWFLGLPTPSKLQCSVASSDDRNPELPELDASPEGSGFWTVGRQPKNKSPKTRCQQKNNMNMNMMNEIKSTPAMVPSCPIPQTCPSQHLWDPRLGDLELGVVLGAQEGQQPDAVHQPRSCCQVSRFENGEVQEIINFQQANKQTLKTLKTNKQSQATTGSTASTASGRTSKLQHGSFMLIQRLMFGVKPPHGIQW